MSKLFIKSFSLLSMVLCILSTLELHAKKGYQQKSIYQGCGKVSKTTRMVKTKPVSGYFKRNSTAGYKYVNPYVRSK